MDGQKHEEKEGANKGSLKKSPFNHMKNKNPKPLFPGSILLVLVLAVGFFFIGQRVLGGQEDKPSVLTVSTLEEIINISEFSTFQAVHNGIAEVMNEKKPDVLDYYVSYEARINAGFDLEKVDVLKDEKAKEFTVEIPEIKITGITVDIASLDYIFQNEKANVSTISEQAYKAAIQDAENESKKEPAIKELAEQNAKNIMTALIKPFIEQQDPGYKLTVKFRGAK